MRVFTRDRLWDCFGFVGGGTDPCDCFAICTIQFKAFCVRTPGVIDESVPITLNKMNLINK